VGFHRCSGLVVLEIHLERMLEAIFEAASALLKMNVNGPLHSLIPVITSCRAEASFLAI